MLRSIHCLSLLFVVWLIWTDISFVNSDQTHTSRLASDNRSSEPTDASRLGQLKLGLAAAFFFGVLLACGLPILLIDCLQRDSSTNTRCSTQSSDQSPSHTSSIVPHYDPTLPKELLPPPNSGQMDGPWDHQGLIDSEPVSSPNPIHAENTDLLTGQPVTAVNSWSNCRRFHDRISSRNPDRADSRRDRSLAKRRFKQCSPFPRSTEAHKLLLRLWFSRFNCFAAGIFLSSGFMELYVDVEEAIGDAKGRLNITSEFPFAPFLTLIGFFLVLSIEQIVWTARNYSISSRPCASLHTRQNSTPDQTPCVTPLSPPVSETAQSLGKRFSFSSEPNTAGPAGATWPTRSSDGNEHLGPTVNGYIQPSSHSHPHMVNPENFDSFGSVLRVIILLSAMSTHSLFEGLAVGLQATVSHTIALFSAILLHKLIISAGIGVNLATALTRKTPDQPQPEALHTSHPTSSGRRHSHDSHHSIPRQVGVSRKIFLYQTLSTVILAGSSPLGVLIGWGLMRQQESALLLMTTGVLQGLACGTFFYVVFCEILPEEFRDETCHDRVGKLLFLILGFILVCLYSLFMPH